MKYGFIFILQINYLHPESRALPSDDKMNEPNSMKIKGKVIMVTNLPSKTEAELLQHSAGLKQARRLPKGARGGS